MKYFTALETAAATMNSATNNTTKNYSTKRDNACVNFKRMAYGEPL
jgi:hypothetical protein